MKRATIWYEAILATILFGAVLAVPAWSQPLEGDRQREAEESERLRNLFLRDEKITIKKGEYLLELDALYTSDRSDVLVGEGGSLSKVTRRRFDTVLVGRYGLLDGLEAVIHFPFFVRGEQETDRGSSRDERVDEGIGDVSGLFRYQLVGERGSIPEITLDVGAKSRTGGDLRGTGFWSARGGVTLVKTIDPVVFFGRLGYSANLERHGVDPGDAVEYDLGMGFSLNDRVSFTMQLSGSRVASTSVHGRRVAGSSQDIISLFFATTVQITRHLFVEPLVGIGLTKDASDVVIGVRLPYRF
jgi:hypothetical protein